MEITPGRVFFGSESLLYALSLLDLPCEIRGEAVEARVEALADAVEWMLLSEIPVIDDWCWPELEAGFGQLELRNLVQVVHPPDLKFFEHAPSTMAPLRNLAGPNEPELERASLELVFETWNRDGLSTVALRYLTKILDYLTCLPIDSDGDDDGVVQEGAPLPELAALGIQLKEATGTAAMWESDTLLRAARSIVRTNDSQASSEDLTFLATAFWESLGMKGGWRPSGSGQERAHTTVLALLNGWMCALTESALQAAAKSGLALFPSTIASCYLERMPLFAPSSRVLLSKLGQAQEQAAQQINDYYFGRYSAVTRLPILFSWVVAKAQTLTEVFEIARDLRDKRDLRAFRRWCAELDAVLSEGRETEAIKMINMAEREIRHLTLPGNQEIPTIEAQISFPPSISFPVPGNWLPSRRNGLVFLRRLNKESLGPVRTRAKLEKMIGHAFL